MHAPHAACMHIYTYIADKNERISFSRELGVSTSQSVLDSKQLDYIANR